jgi:FtsH-binding integral membrane protein
MMTTQSVWQRSSADAPIISDRLYNVVIGAVLLWGFLVNYLMVTLIPAEAVLRIPWFLLLIGYFGLCFLGIYTYNKSDKPALSFLGYNLVVVPIGIVIVPFVQSFDPEIVARAVMVTGLVTALMMILGTLYPAFFFRIAGALFVALLAVIVVELGLIFIGGVRLGIMDWIVALIFCGYIGYDWARANAIPKTVDNAVDAAASLYLDIINLFLRILSIMGRRR